MLETQIGDGIGAEGPDACTVDQFCVLNNISRRTYFNLKKEGKGPREMHVGARILISREARRDWRRRMEAEASA